MEENRYSTEVYCEALRAMHGIALTDDRENTGLIAAAKAAGLDFADVEAYYRATYGERYDERRVTATWDKCTPSGTGKGGSSVGPGTLIYLARKYAGFRPPLREGFEMQSLSRPRRAKDFGPLESQPPVFAPHSCPLEPILGMTAKEQAEAYLNELFYPCEYIATANAAVDRKTGRKFPTNQVYTKTSGEHIKAIRAMDDGDGEGWITRGPSFDQCGPDGKWVKLNPLNGGGLTAANVVSYRYTLIEFDEGDLGAQRAVLEGLHLPIAAMVYSGGKSIHAIVKVDAPSLEQYERRVKFIHDILKECGVRPDPACTNPDRYTRLPGFWRGTERKGQALLALDTGAYSWGEWCRWVEEFTPFFNVFDDDTRRKVTDDDRAADLPEGTYFNKTGSVQRVQQNVFGNHLIKTRHVCRIGDRNAPLAVWDGRRYDQGASAPELAMVEHYSAIKRGERDEVRGYLGLVAPVVEKAPERYIGFANGVLDIEAGELLKPSPDLVIANVVPYDYNPEADTAEAEAFLWEVADGDAGTYANLEETIGLCLYPSARYRVAPVLIGKKRNGKSTFLNILMKVLGEENYCAIGPAALKKDTRCAELSGKLANFVDDLSNEFVSGDAGSILKAAISGGVTSADVKYKDAIKFRPNATFVFAANEWPRTQDHTGGMMDRLHPIECRRFFAPEECDPGIEGRLTTEEGCKAFIVLGLRGLARVIESGCMTQTEASRRIRAEIERDNDTVLQWRDSDECRELLGKHGGTICGLLVARCYESYQAYCEGAGVKPVSLTTFSPRARDLFGVTVRRKRLGAFPNPQRVFVPADAPEGAA